jgi:hypothetical protein
MPPGIGTAIEIKGEKNGIPKRCQGSGYTTHFSAKGCCFNLYYYLQSGDFYEEGKGKNHSN